MSLRLKAATFAALALSAASAITASDISSASEAPPSTTALVQEYQGPSSVPSTGEKSSVIFAAPKEVVQRTAPTPGQATSFYSDPQATSLAALVDAQGDADGVDREMRCLAGAVYFESKGESLEGQLAVARVIINRSKSGRFADSLCGVVLQRGQFSFVRGGDVPSIPEGSRAWHEAVAIAQIALADGWDSRAEGALYFHARRVSPGWGRPRLASIDNHIFYR
ncbi:MAG: cell wall hydrolase [Sphingobium sp.]